MPPGPWTESEIRDWCLDHIGQMVDDPAIPIGPDIAFAQMGLDSATSVYFIVELEEWLGTELDPELVVEHPTITALAHHIVAHRGGGNAGSLG